MDISTMYTKDKNKKSGRRGYGNWKGEKENSISPASYGDYILHHNRKNKKGRNK